MCSEYKWSLVLFDVDGTLVDSKAVILKAFHCALEHLGVPDRTDEQLSAYVGPPLSTAFHDMGFSGEDNRRAVDCYRTFYRKFFLDPLPFPGIETMLQHLTAAGIPLATATSKQVYMARDQLTYLHWDTYFTIIGGATPDPACDKAAVIRDTLSQLEQRGVDTSRPVLVGDRFYDVEGAAHAGIPAIGVQWGYAEPDELDGAIHMVATPEELTSLILQHH